MSVKEALAQDQREARIYAKSEMLRRLGGRCVDCEISDPRVLAFDHKIPADKQYQVTDLMTAKPGSKRWAVLLSEVDKCELRCMNCHHIRSVESGHVGRSHGGTVTATRNENRKWRERIQSTAIAESTPSAGPSPSPSVVAAPAPRPDLTSALSALLGL